MKMDNVMENIILIDNWLFDLLVIVFNFQNIKILYYTLKEVGFNNFGKF